MINVVKNFNKIASKIPFLGSVIRRVNDAEIRYGLYAGSHVSILTGNRVSTDVDFLVHDDDMAKLKQCFPYAKTKDYGDGVFLYIGASDEIEFMSQADVNVGDSHYSYRLTDLCWDHTESVNCGNFKVRLLNVVDTMLLKAALQRGEDVGKHDLEDIEALLKHCEIDGGYLQKRLDEVGRDERIMQVLGRYNLI